MSEKTRDLLIRAAKTFVQAFISSVVANLTLLTDALGDNGRLKSVALAVGIGAFAAAISAAWNGFLAVGTDTGKGENSNDGEK